jgi:predicted aspartyl protease
MLLLPGLLAVILVQARVNSQPPAPFILDTGAGVVLLDKRFAIQAGLQGAARSVGHDIGGKEVASHSLTLSRISIGSASVERVPAVTFPLPLAATFLGGRERAGGIIGAPFLSHYVVAIDYARHTVRFLARYQPPANAHAVPMTFTPDGIPVIAIRVDGVTAHVIVDTGNVSYAILWPAFAAKLRLLQRARATYRTHENGVAGSARATALRVASVELGGAVVRNLAVDVPASKPAGSPPSVDGNIGEDLLDRFVVTLDYIRHEAYFTPTAATKQYRAYTPTGMSLRRNASGTMTVTAVTAGTPAAQAGFQAGDTVLRIGGESIRNLTSDAVAERVRASLGEIMRWTIERAGRSMTLFLRPRDLLPAAGA